MKHDLRKLNRRMQRMEDRHRREMTALRNEMLAAIVKASPPEGGYLMPPSLEPLWRRMGYRLTPEGYPARLDDDA